MGSGRLKIATTSDLYYSIRHNFQGGDAWNRDHAGDFKKLLGEYQAEVNRSARDPGRIYACDHLGVSPGIDTIDFHDEKSYTMFIMRWA